MDILEGGLQPLKPPNLWCCSGNRAVKNKLAEHKRGLKVRNSSIVRLTKETITVLEWRLGLERKFPVL